MAIAASLCWYCKPLVSSRYLEIILLAMVCTATATVVMTELPEERRLVLQ